jgi:hypothetical protein
MQYLTVPLLKGGAKDLFFKCVVVYMVYDVNIIFKIINILGRYWSQFIFREVLK